MKRLAAILCVTGMMACTTEFSTDDSGSDSWADTSVDTTEDTHPDVPVDTDTPDVPGDTSMPDIPVDTAPADVTTDPVVDPDPDTSTCEPITDMGTCNVVEQCGCAWGHFCTWDVNTDSCNMYETCEPGTGGTLGPERTCFNAEDCLPGSVCMGNFSGTAGYCLNWCRDDGDCPVASHPCIPTISLPHETCGEVTPPVGICGTGACEEYGCAPFDATACPDGETCAWDKLCDTMYCTPAGEIPPGEPCWEGYCMAGTMCIMGSDDVPRCASFCMSDEDCGGDGFCSSVGSSHPDVMLCM